jgi:hypothetical protein
VALSSTEAEYASLSETSKEIMLLRGLCKALGHKQNDGTMIMQDITGSLSWANGTAKFGRSKHIDIKYILCNILCNQKKFLDSKLGR